MNGSMEGWMLLLVVLAVVIAVLWILLPFAVFGLKGRIDELIEQQKLTNTWLQELATRPAESGQQEGTDERPRGRHISFDHTEPV